MNYKTPGVFVEEIALFPPSIAAVATAIPAFVGHTQTIIDISGKSLVNRPTPLTSLLEFIQLFGGAYNPSNYSIQLGPSPGYPIIRITPANSRKYFLFDALRHYFDNGGGPCYVVTVGNFTTDVIFGDNYTGLRGGLQSLEKEDEPTILVIPDSVALKTPAGLPDFTASGNLHKAMLDQCGRLQDRFSILDIMQGDQPPGAQILQFRTESGTENLKYSATYYPWFYTTYLKDIKFSQLKFEDDQAVPVPIPDAVIDTITGNPILDGLVTSLRSRIAEEQHIFAKITEVTLNRKNFTPLNSHLETLRAEVLAANTAALVRPAFEKMISFARELALSFRDLENDAGLPAELVSQLTSLKANTSLRAQLVNLISYEKNPDVMSSVQLARGVAQVEADYASLENEDWIGGETVATILAETGTDFTNVGLNSIAQTAHSAANSSFFQTAFNTIAQHFTAVVESAFFRTDQVEKLLFAQHPFFKAVVERVKKEMSLQPPSGALAGIYALTDRTRGVWKSPANVSLRSVISPAYKLTEEEQATLNIHPTGKSINAIRAFTGKGILVWGARTLAGNDNEWRYVNVRRFFNFVEESARKASEPFVFESNDANLWVRIRAMIENFLTLQWRQGALTGATTNHAFYVKVGLNETMTAQDILEGRLIVEIGMAVVRPAEFIILRFSHKMQES